MSPPGDAVYRGRVEHRRTRPVTNDFTHSVQLALLHIDDDRPPDGLTSRIGSPIRFRRADYLGDPRRPLAACVLDAVEHELGRRPDGSVHLLANVRMLGRCFNPLAVYYCYDDDDLDAVVLDVCNTPWGERHSYVFDAASTSHRAAKRMHVSPFMPMDLEYRVEVSPPGPELVVQVDVHDDAGLVLGTSLELARVDDGARSTARTLMGRPWSSWAVTTGIHAEAFRLWRAGAPIHRHPGRAPAPAADPGVSPVTPPLRLPRAANAPARSVLLTLAGRGRGGTIVVDDAHGRRPHGRGELRAEVRVDRPDTWRSIAGRGSIGLGASYFDGWWDSADLVDLVRILIRDIRPVDRVRSRAHRSLAPLTEPLRRRQASDRDRAQRDVRAHYDLGNELFEQFLDDTLMYSAAIFPHAGATLEEASRHKLDRVVEQLGIQPGDRVLEIGSGWGGFALHAVRAVDCHVTTTTVSRRQHEHLSKRIAELGLGDRVTVLLDDYRDLTGTYDRLVSIEMIEAVDWRDHDTFFATCSDRLRPGGTMLLQAILIADDRFERAKNTTEFIRHFIFPGGCLPSASSLERSLAAAGLGPEGSFETGPHYARTLREWRRRFDGAADELERLGFDLRFRRMWRFYLAYCEAAFLEGHIHGTQLLIRKPM